MLITISLCRKLNFSNYKWCVVGLKFCENVHQPRFFILKNHGVPLCWRTMIVGKTSAELSRK